MSPSQKRKCFYEFAEGLADLSKCKRSSVGCVIVTPELTEVLAIGYNGPPSGISNDACRKEVGSCGCIHSEANALVKLVSSRDDLVLLTTLCPCEHCAGLIINSKRIVEVSYRDNYRDTTGKNLLQDAGIRLEKWNRAKNRKYSGESSSVSVSRSSS